MKIDVIVTGVAGRVGGEIARAVLEDEACRLVGATEAAGHAAVGREIGSLIGRDAASLRVADSLAAYDLDTAVVIDFTTPPSTHAHLERIRGTAGRIVIGTTALTEKNLAFLRETARENAVLFSPNMSLGVNLLFYLTGAVASKIGRAFDIEIIEAHHRHKKDAPSGTARHLGEIAAESIGRSYADAVRHGRAGMTGERPAGEIGMHAVRGGDIVGDHTVVFAGDGERIELRHMAHSRRTFAQGAVTAAKWISRQGPGLYSMRDVLGI